MRGRRTTIVLGGETSSGEGEETTSGMGGTTRWNLSPALLSWP